MKTSRIILICITLFVIFVLAEQACYANSPKPFLDDAIVINVGTCSHRKMDYDCALVKKAHEHFIIIFDRNMDELAIYRVTPDEMAELIWEDELRSM